MENQTSMRKQNKPNLRTVAKAVDLSPTAVSLALRGDNSIPIETRQRVVAAAHAQGYKYVSRAKKRGAHKLRRLVFVVNDYSDEPATSNPFYGYILNGAEEACRSRDAILSFVLLPHHYQESAELPAVLLHELDGVLLASPYPRALVERIYRENGCPIVLIDNSLTGSNFDSVMADDFGGGYQVAKHLLDLGHRNILMVAGRALNPVIPPSFCERYRGYQQACLDAGIEPMEMAVLPPAIDPPSLECVEPLLEEWLGALFAVPNPPTAIFCAADLIAVGVMAALSGLGIRVPEDVSLVGFDNLPMASTLKHSLTSVHVYKRGMARVAVDLLLARIEEEDTPAMNITLTTQLIVRESTSAVGSPK